MRRTVLHVATTFAIACGTSGVLNAQTAQTEPATGKGTAVVYSGCLQPGSALAGSRTLTPGASTTNTPPLSGYILTNARPSASPGTAGMSSPGSTGRVPGNTAGTTSPSTTATPPAAMPPEGQSAATTTPPAEPPPTTPTATTAPSVSNAGTMFHVVGLQDDELQKMSNQQVEIRGMIESTDTTAAAGVTGERGQPRSSQPATPANPATGTAGTTEAVGTSSGSSSGQPIASSIPSFRATSIRVLSTTCSGGTM